MDTYLEVALVEVSPHSRVEGAECEAEDLSSAEHAEEAHHLFVCFSDSMSSREWYYEVGFPPSC